MSILSRLLRSWVGFGAIPREKWSIFGADPETPGTSITESKLQTQITWMTCVELKARDISKLPILLYRNGPDGARSRATDDPRYWLLKSRPNPETPRLPWILAMAGNLWIWGNAYAFIERNRMSKRPAALWPLPPAEVAVERINGRLYYQWHPVGGEPQTWPASEVLHLKRFTLNGITGISPIGMIRLTAGQQIKADEYAHKFYDNAAMMSGVISSDGELDDEGRERLKTSFKAFHQGVKNAFSLLVLEAGTKYQHMVIPQKDAQFVESNRFRAEQLSAFAGIPMYRLNDLTRATYSNVQQNNLSYLQDSLLFECENITQELDFKLIGAEENLYFEFLFDAILQADSATKYDALQKQFYMGRPLNELRALDNLPPVEGGDAPLVPVNMLPLARMLTAPPENPAPSDSEPDPATDTRAQRRVLSRKARFRIAAMGSETIRDIIQRIVRKEIAGIKSLLGKVSATDPWATLVESYYDESLTERVKRDIEGVLRAIIRAVRREVEEELGDEIPEADVETFVQRYAEGFATRHNRSSRLQLVALGEDAESLEDLQSTVRERLDEWEVTRAQKEAAEESHRTTNAAARVFYIALGIVLLRWVASATACPICQEMDGRVTGTESPFVGRDDSVDPGDDKTAPLSPRGPVFSPPLHGGCSCTIEPGG